MMVRIHYQVSGSGSETLEVEKPDETVTEVTPSWAAKQVHAVRGVWANRVIIEVVGA